MPPFSLYEVLWMNREFHELYLRCFPQYPTSLETFTEQLRPERSRVIAEYEGGILAGYAMIHGGSVSLLCVAEEFRRHGIGSRLLAAAEDHIRGREEKKVILGRGPYYLLQGVPDVGNNVSFFEKRGYSAGWTSINMSMPLGGFDRDKLNIFAPPQGIRYRMAKPEDLPALLEAVNDAEPGWAGIYENCRDPIHLAELDGKIAGFEILADDGGYFVRSGEKVGSIGCVGVRKSCRCRGIGLDMVSRGVQWLQEHGCTRIELRYTWLEDWYGRLGFRTSDSQWMGEKVL